MFEVRILYGSSSSSHRAELLKQFNKHFIIVRCRLGWTVGFIFLLTRRLTVREERSKGWRTRVVDHC